MKAFKRVYLESTTQREEWKAMRKTFAQKWNNIGYKSK